MKDRIKVIIDDEQEALKVPKGLRMIVRRCCNAVLMTENYNGAAEVYITFTDDEQLSGRKNDGEDADGVVVQSTGNYSNLSESDLGRIFISLEFAESQSLARNNTFESETALLTVYGVLKLLGYKDDGNYEKVIIRDKEENILKLLGLTYIRHI